MEMPPNQDPNPCEDVILDKFLDFIFDQGLYQKGGKDKSDSLLKNIEIKSFESLVKMKDDHEY